MAFTIREAATMLGISPAQIRALAAKGLLPSEADPDGELRLGFQDLVILRTAGELAAANIPQRRVQRVLERLRDRLPAGRSLAAVRIAADGERVVVREEGAVYNPESGQSLFDFSVAELAAQAEPLVRAAVASAFQREQTLQADEWYDLGCDLEVSSPREAKDAYKRTLDLDPHHADAHVNLGRLLHEEGTPAAAERHYREAMRLNPEHPTAAFNLGVALEDLGRWTDAIDAYRRAIELDSENADAYYNIAGILEKRGDKPGALRYLKSYRNLLG
jgi:tetratricopeptide (TPR) repeat protein